jgi:hypothetical protein
MGLLEDLSSGKYNLVLFGILFIFIFHQYWCASQTKFEPQGKAGESSITKSIKQIQCKDNKESMADVSNDIKEAVKQVYLADVEAIRNLSEVATKLQAGGYTIAGDLTVKGTILSNSISPIGSIIMWSGSNALLPNNWKFCDGSNGTPDLRGRFIMGTNKQLDGNSVSMGPLNFWADRGATGGTKDSIVVSHSHNVTDPGHTHDQWNGQDRNYKDGTGGMDATRMSSGNYSGTVIKSNKTGITIIAEGSNGTNANLPPYYTLAFIMRIS